MSAFLWTQRYRSGCYKVSAALDSDTDLEVIKCLLLWIQRYRPGCYNVSASLDLQTWML